jgi:hypothetical protein
VIVRSFTQGAIAPILLMIVLVGSIIEMPANAQSSGAAGTVNFFVDARTDFTAWLDQPTESEKQFMRDNYYRMQTYAPYFDTRLSWYPNAWEYKDAYAIYLSGSDWENHPEWILKDAAGNYLYIPFGCNGDACPQYAGDIGNPLFRANWIEKQKSKMDAGYLGIWVDDVNMASIKVGDNNGNSVVPIDPRTGQEMTLADWRRYFADFMEDVRAAFPAAEIAHNVHWWAETSDVSVTRQLLAADYINLERGITDNGIRKGTGKYGFETFIAFVDWLHSQGKQVILDDDDDSGDQERDYELAFYHLINNGGDMLGADGDRGRMSPGNFWSGYTLNLGEPIDTYYRWNGLFRRDFSCGMVLVNQPEMTSISVDLPVPFTAIDGQLVTAVTLASSSGQILKKPCNVTPLTLDIGWVPQAGTKGQFYWWGGLNASGGKPPYSWELVGGWIQWPMTLDQNGTILGVPAEVSTAYFTVEVTDADSATATVQSQITVKQSDYVCGNCHSSERF